MALAKAVGQLEALANNSRVRQVCIGWYTAVYIVLLVFNGLASRPDGRLFKNPTSAVSEQYSSLITPKGFTFSIWGIIYFWLTVMLVYILSTLVRSTPDGDKKLYEESVITHPFFLLTLSLNYLLNMSWLLLWDRQFLTAAAVVLWLLTLAGLTAASFNYFRIYDQGFQLVIDNPKELWLNRIIVQNGLEVYVTWTIVASFVNSVLAAQYPGSGRTPADPRTAAISAIAVLFVLFLVWFPFEITKFDKYCRYAITQYAVIPWAMGGIYARRSTINYPQLEGLIIALMVAGLIMLAIKILLILYKWKVKKPIYPNKDDDGP